MSTGGVKAHVAASCGCKQVGLRGGYPGRRLVCSRASSMYWFKVSFLRGKVQKAGKSANKHI